MKKAMGMEQMAMDMCIMCMCICASISEDRFGN